MVQSWLAIASIVLVQVPGSIAEERPFSKLAYIKDERRNSLDREHLNACLMLAMQRIGVFTVLIQQSHFSQSKLS